MITIHLRDLGVSILQIVDLSIHVKAQLFLSDMDNDVSVLVPGTNALRDWIDGTHPVSDIDD
jgi:hypothetical protein